MRARTEFLSRLLETKGLHMMDAEVLTIARERKGFVVINDEVARKTAKVYVIPYVGTPYVLMRAVSEKLITKERTKLDVNGSVSHFPPLGIFA